MALFTLDLCPQPAGRGLPTQLLVTLVGDDEVELVLAHDGVLLMVCVMDEAVGDDRCVRPPGSATWTSGVVA
jgi:hypothetical protein